MNSTMLPEVLFKNRSYNILSFFSLHPHQAYYDKEISEKTGVSRGATNQVLNNLLQNKLVSRERRGKMWFYSLSNQPLIRYFRVFENLVKLTELVNRLSPLVKRIILFGSVANGTDTHESDIDLFVMTDEPEVISKEIRNFKIDRVIKPVIQTPLEYATSKDRDKVFYNEVAQGIVLFERETNE